MYHTNQNFKMRNIIAFIFFFGLVNLSYSQTLTRFSDSDILAFKQVGDSAAVVVDKEIYKQQLVMITGEKHNEEMMYDSLYSVYLNYKKVDEYNGEQIVGKINTQLASDLRVKLKEYHPYFMSGGVFFYERKDYSQAASFFEAYCDIPFFNVFKEDLLIGTDSQASEEKLNSQRLDYDESVLLQTRYYAAVSAITGYDHKRAIRLLNSLISKPFKENDTFQESEIYELLADQYNQIGDNDNYINTLKIGVNKFPQSKYFLPSYINVHISSGQLEDAAYLLEQLMRDDPSNLCAYGVTLGNIYASINKYDEANNVYSGVLKKDSDCQNALEGLAVSYILEAQSLKEQVLKVTDKKQQKKIDKNVEKLYKKSYPLLENLRQKCLKGKGSGIEIKSVLIKLQNVYYNLKMEKEQEIIEEELAKYTHY